ncbi:hypothetical protein HDU91_001610, partial [Kappamyces sp. JEL0680]
FQLFSDDGCSGNVESLELALDKALFSSPTLGDVSGALRTIHNGWSKVGWTQYSPGEKLIPRVESPLEILAIFFYVTCLGLYVSTFGLNLHSFLTKRRSSSLVLCMVSQFVWVLFVCVQIGFNYTIYTDLSLFFTVSDTNTILESLAPLTSTLVTAEYLMRFYRLVGTRRLLGYALLFVLYLCCALPIYIEIGCGEIFDWASDWITYGLFSFSIFMFTFDFIPPCAIVVIILRNAGHPASHFVSFLFQANQRVFWFLVADLATLVGYFISDYILNWTAWNGSDRNLLSFLALAYLWKAIRK